ncbi:MAG: hypothetical protein U1F05_06225 [Burkholderiales bacterium]
MSILLIYSEFARIKSCHQLSETIDCRMRRNRIASDSDYRRTVSTLLITLMARFRRLVVMDHSHSTRGAGSQTLAMLKILALGNVEIAGPVSGR